MQRIYSFLSIFVAIIETYSMDQIISQEEVWRIIISNMMKKRNSIVPVIGEDTIVYKDEVIDQEFLFLEFVLRKFQRKYSRVTVDNAEIKSVN